MLGEEKFDIKFTDNFEDEVVITAKQVSEEQISSLETKLKEKYTSLNKEEKEENAEEEHNHNTNQIIRAVDMPAVEVYDLIKSYIEPMIIVTIAVIIVLAIFFRKLGVLKAIIYQVFLILGINLVYISAVAITRIAVNEYIISIGVFVYSMSLIISTLFIKSKLKI